jgi:hypothetical protein
VMGDGCNSQPIIAKLVRRPKTHDLPFMSRSRFGGKSTIRCVSKSTRTVPYR